MENKMFELLTRMYNEFSNRFDRVVKNISGLKEDVTGLKEDVTGLKEDVTGLKEDVTGLKEDVIRIENKLDSSTKALFDGYMQTHERLGILEKKVDELSGKFDRHEVEIKVIKGGRKM